MRGREKVTKFPREKECFNCIIGKKTSEIEKKWNVYLDDGKVVVCKNIYGMEGFRVKYVHISFGGGKREATYTCTYV